MSIIKKKGKSMNPLGRPVVFRGHLGLGDHIICNAIVRHLAETNSVIVPAKKINFVSVKHMFSDLKNVVVKPFSHDDHVDRYCRAMSRTGFRVIWNGDVGEGKTSWKKSIKNWDERFYEQMGLDFCLRWEKFRIPNDRTDGTDLFLKCFQNRNPDGFIFLHHTSSTGRKPINESLIRHDNVFIPDMRFTDNIFDYVPVLKKAKEVHCIDSSFLCLADSFDLKGGLHYHAYAKDPRYGPRLRRNWIIHT